jgi:spermidine/putrescine transport system substrate-binding protein
MHPDYDRNLSYSLPLLWGMTGIFVNKQAYSPNSITKWADLWDKKFNNQLMLLDDTREVFAMALISLGYSGNDHNPEHIKQAYLKLKDLMDNVKVFSTETVVSIMIDGDANAGMAWNGDAYKAYEENNDVMFIYPKDGFMIWVDNIAIAKTARHKDAAYQFLNFLLRPDIAKQIAIATSYPIANLAGEKLLPESMRNNPTAYPSSEVLKHGEFEMDVSDETLALYEQYWEKLKMGS